MGVHKIYGQESFHLSLSWRDRALVWGWCAQTNVPDVYWHDLYTLKFAWPPLRHVVAFVQREPGEEK